MSLALERNSAAHGVDAGADVALGAQCQHCFEKAARRAYSFGRNPSRRQLLVAIKHANNRNKLVDLVVAGESHNERRGCKQGPSFNSCVTDERKSNVIVPSRSLPGPELRTSTADPGGAHSPESPTR